MELRHLRYFTAVAENGGIGRAARMLHVAQSAVSETIRDLETELGVTLLDRSSRRIRLTDAGELFLEDAKLVLASANRAMANMQKSLRGELGTMSIGFFVGGFGSFAPKIIKEFRQQFTGVQVSLVEMMPATQVKALQTGAIDIGFTRPLEATQTVMLRSELFQTEPLYVVLPRNHPLAAQQQIAISELEQERFVLNDRKYSPALFDKIINLCTDAGFSPTVGTMASAASGVIALVEAGEGVAILSGGSSIFSAEVAFVPLSDAHAAIDIVVAWSPQHETPVLRSFLDLVRRKRREMTATSAG